MNLPASATSTIGLLLLEILLSLVFGWGLMGLGLGRISYLLGGVAAGLVLFWTCHQFSPFRPQPQKWVRKLGQGIVGLTIGYSITSSDLGALIAGFPIYGSLTLAAIGSGIGVALVYARTFQINVMTALLATTPAGVGIMASVAADYGKNVSLVGVTQVTRITTVVLIIPLVISAIFPDSSSTSAWMAVRSTDGASSSSMLLLLLAILLAWLGVRLATWVKLPVAPMLGAMLAGVGFGLGLDGIPWESAQLFTMPRAFTILGQILLGLHIGEYWGCKPITQPRLLLGTLQANGLTLLAGLGLATAAHIWAGWDWMTSLLATSPGGSSEMVLIALVFDQDHVGTVTTAHLFRVLGLNGLLPVWLGLFRFLEQRYPGGQE